VGKRPAACSFELGDLALATSNASAAAETGHTRRAVGNAVRVARAFPPARRRNLTWAHHASVVALPEPEQDHWLQEAEKHGWSSNTLRARLREAGVLQVSQRGKGNVALDPTEAFELYNAMGPRRTLQKVADHFAVSINTVKKYAAGRHSGSDKRPWHVRLAERERKDAEIAENEDLRNRARRRKQIRDVLDQSGREILRRIDSGDPEQPLTLQGYAALAKVVAAQEGEATENVQVHHVIQVLPQLVTDWVAYSLEFVAVERHDEFLAGAEEFRVRYRGLLEAAEANGHAIAED
jgi:hypothetical protein